MADIKIIQSPSLSGPYDPRYVVADADTGEIIDDAQGYGYKSPQKARAAYNYKNRSPEQKERAMQKWVAVQAWCEDHRKFVRNLEDGLLYLAKDGETLNAKILKEEFKAAGYNNLPFTAGDFLRYWNKYPKKSEKKEFQKRIRKYKEESNI